MNTTNAAYDFIATDHYRVITELLRDGLDVTANACLVDYEEDCRMTGSDAAAELTEADFRAAIVDLVATLAARLGDEDEDTARESDIRAAARIVNN